MWSRVVEWLVMRVLARLFPRRYRLVPRRSDGAPLLRQFKIFDWLYLQSFVNPEERELFHNHRWRYMRSFVLSGHFWEERFPGTHNGGALSDYLFVEHKAPSTYMMGQSTIHRIHWVAPRTWTLFFMFHNDQDWWYFPRQEVEHRLWEEAIPDERKVPSL